MVIKFTKEQFYKAFEMAKRDQDRILKKAKALEKKERKNGERS